MTGDMYMCEHVSKPTAGKCFKCASEHLASRELAQSNSKSEDTPHRHRVAKLDVDTRAIFCECGAFLNETGKWLDTEVDYFEVAKYGSANASLPSKLAPEPPQDTSLTEITAEYFMATDPDRVALQRKVLAWHKAEIAKLFEQIRSEAVRMNIPWGDGNGYDVVKAIDVEVLTRLEQK